METANLEGKELRPERLSRRGEMIAWGLALLVAAGWLVLVLSRQHVLPAVPILTGILALSGASISLGNWMDRRTSIRISAEGIHFTNGLRDASFRWREIRQAQVFPSTWGSKVSVIGPTGHFEFRTLGEVKVQGDVKGRMGFAQGEQILQHVLARANLFEAPPPPAAPSRARYYYARQ